MLFIELIEATSSAVFLSREEKAPWIRLAIRKLDTTKVLLMILWEVLQYANKAQSLLRCAVAEKTRH